MSNPLLKICAQFVTPFLVLGSVALLLRGHNHPGGGFIGGLMLGSAVALYLLSTDRPFKPRLLKLRAVQFAALGLLASLLSGVYALLLNQPFMTAAWGWELWLPLVGKLKLGSVLLFDFGVFLLVAGMASAIALSLFKERV